MEHIKLFESFNEGRKKVEKESLEDYFDKKKNEDLTVPYKSMKDVPFVSMVSKKMKSYFEFQSINLIEPRLLEYTRFAASGYNGAMVPLCGHSKVTSRHLGLLTYDFEEPISKEDLELMKKKINEYAKDQYPNFTIFTDVHGNSSAAWGDKDKVKFLIEKFSSEKRMKSITIEDHKNLGKWFGYKPEMTELWIKKNARK